MKLVVILIVLLLFAALINFLRGDFLDAPLVQSLPLLGGHPPSIFDVGAGIMLLITAWGVARLLTRKD